MSRIGKQPIAIPAKVKVDIKGNRVLVEGPKGKLDWELPARTAIKVEGDKILVSRAGDDAKAKALHGLSRALVNNMVKGVSEGFVKKLEIQGVGFKAAVQGKTVSMNLGYSHPINYPLPDQIKVTSKKTRNSRSKDRTNRWSGKSPLRFAVSIRRSRTKAKAFDM